MPIGRTGGSESASRSLQPIQFYSGANETGKFRSNQLKIALQSREAELLFAVLGDAKQPYSHQDIKRPPVRGGVGSSESASPFFFSQLNGLKNVLKRILPAEQLPRPRIQRVPEKDGTPIALTEPQPS